jgi:hypothetical protein
MMETLSSARANAENAAGHEPVSSHPRQKIERPKGINVQTSENAAPAMVQGEIVAHLADAEIVIGWRVRSILGAPGTPIQAFDQDAWVKAGHYAKRSPHASLAQFRAAREANLLLYKSLTPDQWKLHGIHSERGPESVEHIARMMAGHDLNHLQQIERILATAKKSAA